MQEKEVLVDVKNLTQQFHLGKKKTIKAVHDMSFQIYRNEILGLVGESGSGKSTAARCVMNIYNPTKGKILYEGVDTNDRKAFQKNRKKLQRERQIIFQDLAGALNQRMTVADIVAEPICIQKMIRDARARKEYVKEQLELVGLDATYLNRRPSELSGGQRQRVAIARAFGMKPRLLVADEPIASLDVSIQAQVIELFLHLKEEHDCAILFIAHDLSMVQFLCDRVGVMCRGHLVEIGETGELFSNPVHPYTKALLSAIPIPDPVLQRQQTSVLFDSSSLSENGKLIEVTPGHYVRQEETYENIL